MKSKKLLIVIITSVFVIGIVLIFGITAYSNKKDKEIKQQKINEKRYKEIKETFSQSYYKYLVASNLTNTDPYYCENSKSGHTYDYFLINNGYLKKEDMKDIDGKSYCKAWGKHWKTDNCGVDYKVYINCKEYKDSGYDSWGEPLSSEK